MLLRPSGLRSLLLVALAVLFAACGDDDATPQLDGGDTDAGRDGSSSKCATSIECDDGLYCNGDELCAPFLLSANAFGCVPARAPCTADEVCDEDTEMCGPMPMDAGEPDASVEVDGGELDAAVEVDGGEPDASVEADGGEPDAEVDGGEADAGVDGGADIDLG